MPSLLNLGSCGLYVVHGSFKTGTSATGWKIDRLLRSLWYVIENSPTRREEYESIGGSGVFPLRFCSTRCLEDIPVAERALEIWPSVIKYVKKISIGPKSKIPSISSFHKKFQSDKPVLPFPAEFSKCLSRQTSQVLEKVNTKAKLANIHVMAPENIVHPKHEEMGVATMQHLRKAEKRN
ncbi:hypothetical protein FSP39_018058 [Pinctada imbricata]|uniref:Uncharacterized protein n=1 Tax=Pinctada imbricata TaxID=66713 RepID=A0AA88XVN4_PINIB|nr:hypothetical protein FSP39_018058 [Pinctada imbricata]